MKRASYLYSNHGILCVRDGIASDRRTRMTTQTINIDLPEDIYQRFAGMAAVTQRPLQDVIYQSIRGNLPPSQDDIPPEQRGLVADLQLLDDEALWVVVREPLPVRQWRRHQHLLHKAETTALTGAEQTELRELREAADRFVTRRSYALALLKWRGYAVPTLP